MSREEPVLSPALLIPLSGDSAIKDPNTTARPQVKTLLCPLWETNAEEAYSGIKGAPVTSFLRFLLGVLLGRRHLVTALSSIPVRSLAPVTSRPMVPALYGQSSFSNLESSPF